MLSQTENSFSGILWFHACVQRMLCCAGRGSKGAMSVVEMTSWAWREMKNVDICNMANQISSIWWTHINKSSNQQINSSFLGEWCSSVLCVCAPHRCSALWLSSRAFFGRKHDGLECHCLSQFAPLERMCWRRNAWWRMHCDDLHDVESVSRENTRTTSRRSRSRNPAKLCRAACCDTGWSTPTFPHLRNKQKNFCLSSTGLAQGALV